MAPEFADDQRESPELRRHSSDGNGSESHSDGEDYGEGESDMDGDDDKSGCTRASLDYKPAKIGDRTAAPRDGHDLSSLGSEGRSGINLGAPDDSANPFKDEAVWEAPPAIVMESPENNAYLIEAGITGLDIEMMRLESQEDCQRLKTAFRLYFPRLMASIVRILLHKGEEPLA